MAPTTNMTRTGTLAILLERGIPASPGEIGCAKPDRWLCVIWANGTTLMDPDLRSDVIGRPPSAEELFGHYRMHPEFWSVLLR